MSDCITYEAWVGLWVQRLFHTAAMGSPLTGGITALLSSTTAQDHKALPRVVRSADKTSGSSLTDNKGMRYRTKYRQHPGHSLLTMLPLGKHYWILNTKDSGGVFYSRETEQ